MRVRFGRLNKAARMQTLHSTFVELVWIMIHLTDADDATRKYCTVKLVTVLEQFLREVIKTLIETGRISPGKLVDGKLPGPERLGGDPLAHHIAVSYTFQSIGAVKSILDKIGLSGLLDRCLCKSYLADLKALFKCRHDIVHTTGKPSPIEIHRCFEAVLILIGCIMPKIYPGGHHLYLYIGDNMFDARMYQEAITYYDRSLAIRPDDPYVLARKGESFARLGLHKKAVACYNQALVLDPNYPVHTRKGESLAETGLHQEAVACYNQALVLDPDNPYTHARKGESLARRGLHREAVECYNRALALDPNYLHVYVKKGELFTKTGLRSEAVACYNQALALNPDDPYITICVAEYQVRWCRG